MLEIQKEVRDEVVKALQVQMVPAVTGAVLMQVVEILKALKEVKPKDLTEDKPVDKNA